jgi:hypothetical protein
MGTAVGGTRVGWNAGQSRFSAPYEQAAVPAARPVRPWCAERGTQKPFGRIEVDFPLFGNWDVALSKECCRGVGDGC